MMASSDISEWYRYGLWSWVGSDQGLVADLIMSMHVTLYAHNRCFITTVAPIAISAMMDCKWSHEFKRCTKYTKSHFLQYQPEHFRKLEADNSLKEAWTPSQKIWEVRQLIRFCIWFLTTIIFAFNRLWMTNGRLDLWSWIGSYRAFVHRGLVLTTIERDNGSEPSELSSIIHYFDYGLKAVI